MDAFSLAAALPVGAANNTRKGAGPCAACNKANKRITVVVFPVPGPPVMMQVRWRKAMAQAKRWLCCGACGSTGPNKASRPFVDGST